MNKTKIIWKTEKEKRKEKFGFFSYILVIIGFTIIFLRKLLFKYGTLGHHWDWTVPPMNHLIKDFLYYSHYAWNTINLGYSRYTFSTIFHLVFYSPSILGIDGHVFSKAFIISTFLIAFASMYFLIKDILDSDMEYISFICFAGALFYAFSPYLFNEILGGGVSQIFVYSITPLPVLLYRKIVFVNYHKSKLFYAILLSFTITLILSSNQAFIVLSVLLWAYTLLFRRKMVNLFYLILSYFFCFLLNLKWFYQLYNYFSQSGGESIIHSGVNLARLTNLSPSLINSYSLRGYFVPLFQFSLKLIYDNLFILVMMMILMFIIYSIILLKPHEAGIKKEFIFWLIIYIGLLIFATGGNPPFGSFVVFLFKNIRLMVLFRSLQHFYKFLLLSFPILFSLSLFIMANKYKQRLYESSLVKKLLIFGSFIIIFYVYANPYFSGDFGKDQLMAKGLMPLDNYRISEGMKETYLRIQNDPGLFRNLPLPMTFSPKFMPSKYQTVGQGVDNMLLNQKHPFISSDFTTNPYSQSFLKLAEIEIYDRSFDPTDEFLLDMMNIKYILIKKDVIPNFGRFRFKFNYSIYKKLLDETPSLKKINEDDQLITYVRKEYSPRAFTSNKLVGVSEIDEIFSIRKPFVLRNEIELLNLSKEDIIYFDDAQILKSNISRKEYLNIPDEKFVSISGSILKAPCRDNLSKKCYVYDKSHRSGGGSIDFEIPDELRKDTIRVFNIFFRAENPKGFESKYKLYLLDQGWGLLEDIRLVLNSSNSINYTDNFHGRDIKYLRLQFNDHEFTEEKTRIDVINYTITDTNNELDRIIIPPLSKEEYSFSSTEQSGKNIIFFNIKKYHSADTSKLSVAVNGNFCVKEADILTNQLLNCKFKLQKTNTFSINNLNEYPIEINPIFIGKFLPEHISTSESSRIVQINPTRYYYTSNQSNTFLIFSESFDPRWEIRKGHVNWIQEFFRPALDAEHFKVNAYANGWILPEDKKLKKITISFRLQKYYNILFILSGIVFLILIIIMIKIKTPKLKMCKNRSEVFKNENFW